MAMFLYVMGTLSIVAGVGAVVMTANPSAFVAGIVATVLFWALAYIAECLHDIRATLLRAYPAPKKEEPARVA